ncbi:MAG: DEAD/DEAH box helicase [Lewinellaceae bacterium]|nr:DEAD/DEAH box helicase [Saprospiraceae bacterium]MCB9338489.1 DEAD/DEAH box helicase [Lewinellaceae bacterium]
MDSKLTFEDLGLSADILEGLKKKGFEHPTPVQAQTIPLLLNGEKDIIAQAQTGTGKTAAFGLPIIERITPGLRKVQAVVLAPTRELASQVCEELESLKGKRNIRILPVYGGQGMAIQLKMLKEGVDIVVATPGRAIDHLNRKTLKLNDVKYLVLDEADEMLNMGFIEDIETILTHVPEDRKTLLFSATMPSAIVKLARKFMGDYDEVKVAAKQRSADTVDQIFYELYEKDKLRALHRLIHTEEEFYALVFCRTRVGADRLASKLSGMNLDVEALHGDVTQAQRERILAKFKKGHSTILVATDVAARGIDINDLSHVINFDMPENSEAYVHRIGRTGRAGKTGKAISFVTPGEFRKIRYIMEQTKTPINKAILPAGQAVIEAKRNAMKAKVFAAAETEAPQDYHTLAQEILASGKPSQVLASLLQLHFGGGLNPNAYPEIAEPERGRSSSGGRSSFRRERGSERNHFIKPSKGGSNSRSERPAGKKSFKRKSRTGAY